MSKRETFSFCSTHYRCSNLYVFTAYQKKKKKENILKDFIDRCTKTHGNGRTSEIKITSVKKTTKSLFTKQEYN